MRRKIGNAHYDLPETAAAAPSRLDAVVDRFVDVAKLVSEQNASTPKSRFERRPCRWCGQLVELRYLEIVTTRAGWRLLCASCRSAGKFDPPNRL